MIYFLSAMLFLVGGAVFSMLWTTWRYGIGPVPTSRKVRQALLKVLPSQIKGAIYELGAGWGSLAFLLADRYPNNRVVAIEISVVPYLWMKIKQFFFKQKNIEIMHADFFKHELVDVSFIVCYLYPEAMARLGNKISGIPSQIDVLTHTFAFPHTSYILKIKVFDLYQTPIYLYRFDKLSTDL